MRKEKLQTLYIHWGMTFKNNDDYLFYLNNKVISLDGKNSLDWDYLKEQLINDCTIIKPRMPLQDNAKYSEWKVIFEKYLDKLNNDIILMGSSLGWVFLAKYLSENKVDKNIVSVYMICPPFDNTLIGEDLVGWFELQNNLSMIESQSNNIKLLFSKDDEVIPISHASKYQDKLPNSEIIIYESKNWHFKIQEFPEIITMIKKDIESIIQ